MLSYNREILFFSKSVVGQEADPLACIKSLPFSLSLDKSSTYSSNLSFAIAQKLKKLCLWF